MTKIMIRIRMPLRSYTEGTDEIPVHAATVGDALTGLGAAHDGILTRVLSPEGELRQFVNVFVGGRNVRSLDGLATRLSDGDVVSIIPAVAGGAPKARDKRLAEEPAARIFLEALNGGRSTGGRWLLDVRRPSSGAFVYGALKLAERGRFRIIVAPLKDTGERYTSTGM